MCEIYGILRFLCGNHFRIKQLKEKSLNPAFQWEQKVTVGELVENTGPRLGGVRGGSPARANNGEQWRLLENVGAGLGGVRESPKVADLLQRRAGLVCRFLGEMQ
jgi:hypothetical protein